MSTHRWFDRICVIVILLSLVVTVLFMNGESLGIQLVVDEDSEGHTASEHFTANDLDGSWDTSGATVITLEGNSARISGNGAYWNDGSLVILQSGRYVISGTLDDGNIVVKAQKYSKVWILLCGVSVTCSDDACLRVDQADKVFLTLAEGTENTLTGGDSLSEAALADETNAVLFSHDDLTVNGSGSLTVVSSYENGITVKDDLVITGGSIVVTAPYHGIRVNESFRFTAANLTVTAGKDAVHTEGDILIQDGSVTLTASDDAIHSDTAVRILGGTLTVTDCYEGIEAVVIEQYGGDISITARDDGLNANGYTGFSFGGGMPDMGEMPEMTGDPPEMPEGGMPEFTDGEMPEPPEGAPDFSSGERPEMPQMPDGTTPQAQDGTTSQMAEGATPGMPESAEQEVSTEEKTVVTAEETYVLIAGGTLTILNENGNDADGIDSNGNILITGGTVFVSLADQGGNNALDCGSESGGTAVISGGTVIACGSGAMAESFDASSAQCSILYGTGDSVAAGTTVSLLTSEGETLLTGVIPCSFSSLLISCPGMAVGDTVRLVIGDISEEITLTETSVSSGESTGMMTPGAFPSEGTGTPGQAFSFPGFPGNNAETGDSADTPAPAAAEAPESAEPPESGSPESTSEPVNE